MTRSEALALGFRALRATHLPPDVAAAATLAVVLLPLPASDDPPAVLMAAIRSAIADVKAVMPAGVAAASPLAVAILATSMLSREETSRMPPEPPRPKRPKPAPV